MYDMQFIYFVYKTYQRFFFFFNMMQLTSNAVEKGLVEVVTY